MEYAAVILALVAVIEITFLIYLVREEKETVKEVNKVFVRFPGGKEYALTEHTVFELQKAGVLVIVEKH